MDAEGTEYVDYVRITPSMLDYDTSDLTIGYRKVTIRYKNQTCQAYVYVWSAELTDVEVAVLPLQNYIYTAIKSEDDLVLTGGIVKLTFTKYTRRGVFAGYMSKYVGMESEDVTYSGFVSGMYSKEGKQITINVIYKDYTSEDLRASYIITVYDRQDVAFSYSNVIFFYGNAAPAAFTAKQSIPEFVLPTSMTLTYAESINMITLADYLDQMEQLKSMGDLGDLIKMIPGMDAKALKDVKVDEKAMARQEAIIRSMTVKERRNPEILNASRRKRIADGRGTSIPEVNRLLKQFEGTRKLMKGAVDGSLAAKLRRR